MLSLSFGLMASLESALQSWQNAPGFDKHAWLSAHAEAAPVTIRVNAEKNVQVKQLFPDLIGAKVPWCNNAFQLTERPSFVHHPAWHAGGFYVQEASSMFLWHVLETLNLPKVGLKVLDLCAAPGGKSTLLASYFVNSLLVGNEVIKSRNAILVENLTKWGGYNTVVVQNDPAQIGKLQHFFDCVVVDAPCSGSGLFRKDQEALVNWTEEQVFHCQARQKRILEDIWPSVKPGGYLVYSTCSYSQEENEDMVDFLLEHEDATSLSIPVPDDWGITVSSSKQKEGSSYRFWPHKVQGEGFFLAVIQKRNNKMDYSFSLSTRKIQPIANKQAILTNQMVSNTEEMHLFNEANIIRMIPTSFLEALEILAAHVYIKKAGVALGEWKGQSWIPHHEYALSGAVLDNYPRMNLNTHDALQYLMRKDFFAEGLQLGWNSVWYDGLCLGWAKVLPNRINNYYPNSWRILKDI